MLRIFYTFSSVSLFTVAGAAVDVDFSVNLICIQSSFIQSVYLKLFPSTHVKCTFPSHHNRRQTKRTFASTTAQIEIEFWFLFFPHFSVFAFCISRFCCRLWHLAQTNFHIFHFLFRFHFQLCGLHRSHRLFVSSLHENTRTNRESSKCRIVDSCLSRFADKMCRHLHEKYGRRRRILASTRINHKLPFLFYLFSCFDFSVSNKAKFLAVVKSTDLCGTISLLYATVVPVGKLAHLVIRCARVAQKLIRNKRKDGKE